MSDGILFRVNDCDRVLKRNLSRYDFFIVQIENVSLLGKDFFRGLENLKGLMLNGILGPDRYEKDVFTGLKSLEFLELSLGESLAALMESGFLTPLVNLKHFFSGVSQKVIKEGVFDGLQKLETIKISNNNLEHIEPGVFRGLPSLKTLKLTWNRNLTKLPVEALNHLEDLTTSGVQGFRPQ